MCQRLVTYLLFSRRRVVHGVFSLVSIVVGVMSATQRVVSQTGTKSFIQGVCFRLLARVRWQYFSINLGCCLADIGQVASGAMASAKSYSKRVWFRNMSTAGPRPTPLVASCLAYLASHDISETARLPYMGCRGGVVLTAYLGMSA